MSLSKLSRLRTELQKRWKELGLKTSDVILDANERGRKLHAAQMSRFLKGMKGGPSEDDILWLSWRWGICVQINLGKAVIKDGKVVYQITPYNEAECLKAIKSLSEKKVFK